MADTLSDPLVADYLLRLKAAAAGMPAAQRAELVTEIRQHIDDALHQAGAADEATIRNVLERLGPPEDIVTTDAAEATRAPIAIPGSTPVSALVPRPGKLEIAALVALGIGGIVPVLGWALGMILVAASGAWSNRDKVTGLLVGLTIAFVAVIIFGFGVAQDSGSMPIDPSTEPVIESSSAGLGPIELAVAGLGFIAGVPTALYLAWRLRQDPGGHQTVANDASRGRGFVSTV